MQEGSAPTRAMNPKWRRYSLRTFLIVVIILCILLGRIATTASRQRNAMLEFQRLGVSVLYEHQWNHSKTSRSLSSRLLEPLTHYVDPNFLLPVHIVRTRYLEAPSLQAGATYTSAEVIDPIAKLSGIRSLSLTHTEVTNQDIAQLAKLRDLESLDLHMTKMHEGPIPGLDQLRLKRLMLNRTRVDDDSIAALRKMTSLEYLDLTRTKVTDAGLKHLESLPKLRKLVLRRALVTQAGYDAFKKTHPNVEVAWRPQ
ncbi:Leucine Rich repeats (2 copies) [Rosistilla carotiformis]|uniref:Leucine Rich repeats (2 copies) n=1 Tax=Rosistilla carotiformis TaxID=2528017 RepID=A0A518JXA2_9BACT|nr:leucine-rich repeat domain-containing protein [Rosistilla carotiformis]QDV70173.1 Leucine Rich repeats (2 copies) [Rosistilla carotiformis]